MDSVYVDEKGKYFTPVIRKEVFPATIQTVSHQIHGYIHVRKDDRVQDELNRTDRFLAITDANIFDNSGNLVMECSFVSINRNQIIWVSPDDDNSIELSNPAQRSEDQQ